MNIFGIAKNLGRASDRFSEGNAKEGAGHLCKAGMAVVPGANLIFGGVVNKAFGISATSMMGPAEDHISHIEEESRHSYLRYQIDSAGNQNGVAEPEDVVIAIKEQGSNALEHIHKFIDFISDI